MPSLYEPLVVGSIPLANRVVMAPLTREGAPRQVPTPLMAEYYAQRAGLVGAGLIISEATQICPEGQGYFDTPGIHSEEQVAGWRRVADAVHRAAARDTGRRRRRGLHRLPGTACATGHRGALSRAAP